MTYFEKEKNLVNVLQEIPCSETLFLSKRLNLRMLYSKIHNSFVWETHWEDRSSKGALPPDFFSDKFKLMLEVMRVDDHGYKKKGKYINPTYERERVIEKKLKQCIGDDGVYESLNIFVVPDTQLSTEQDHNYKFYLENFRRVLNKHKSKIDTYRKNHPGYKIVFYVFDESCAYMLPADPSVKRLKHGETVTGQPHNHFLDTTFLECFIESDIDYLIWCTPFKMFVSSDGVVDFPKVCVFDCKKKIKQQICYDKDRMIATEE